MHKTSKLTVYDKFASGLLNLFFTRLFHIDSIFKIAPQRYDFYLRLKINLLFLTKCYTLVLSYTLAKRHIMFIVLRLQRLQYFLRRRHHLGHFHYPHTTLCPS